jgi:transposase-like protein
MSECETDSPLSLSKTCFPGGKTLVMIAALVDGVRVGRIRLKIIPDASAVSLESAIIDTVEPGTRVRTDGWKSYSRLSILGYTHEVIRKDSSIGDDLLPNCHRVASLLKRWLMGTHQGAVSHEHLEYYLDEFTFRFNRRTSRSRGKLSFRLIQQAATVDPAPVKSLVKNARGRRPAPN